MAAVARERELLKLVHPGGFVEVHRQPVVAVEVMKKNPRHCITRPDVFKFPWIVVRPESLLSPGNVFYIVPNRTIYRLLHRDDPQNRSNRRSSTLANPSFNMHHTSKLRSSPILRTTPKLRHCSRQKEESSEKKIVCKGVVDEKGDAKCVNNSEVVLKSCLRNREDRERLAWNKYIRVTFVKEGRKRDLHNQGSAT